jgi:hypothetical protein
MVAHEHLDLDPGSRQTAREDFQMALDSADDRRVRLVDLKDLHIGCFPLD